ncbi:uncharacterized protein Dwil_GK27976 [Drosophila willistoni]|uniref:Ionotropic glutamate receptor C-terminal domain-containing protein n=1 Tax=Drosophila willistoni TaxID=7260 RepID=A0A0Q9WPT9_DROWI|nr:uncharacterized protein LOC26529978 [Drosophila willistoni]KRF98144.1 uncharacterized protein Dwil_GK27976 [Drosophila willistoni]
MVMCYSFLLESLLLGLLIEPIAAWNLQYVHNFLRPFAAFNAFQEIVWFVSQKQQVPELDQFIRIVDEAFGATATQTVINNNTELRMIRAPARRNHMSFVFTTGVDDPIMEVYNKVLLGRHFYFSVVMLIDNVTEIQLVHDLCRYLYDYQFFNSMIYFQSADGVNQLYGASKFPSMQIENRTDFQTYLRKSLSKVVNARSDVGGYGFPTPLRQDMPHLFRSQMGYDGSTYRIIETFVRFINGSFAELPLPPDALGGKAINMKQALQLVRDRRVEFLAHAYALFMPDEGIEKSYPLLVVQWCLMVPTSISVSTYFYPLQPFDFMVWFFVLGAFVALILLELLWLSIGKKRHSDGINDALLNSFCYIINIATARQLQKPPILRFLLLAAVFFYGFFLSANYTSTLGSILTVNLFHAQINTMEDIIRAQLPVMIIDYELEFLLQLHKELPEEFVKLLRPVDSGIFAEHQTNFNSTHAYFVTEDQWQFLDEQQKHLKQRIFKMSSICFGSYHLAYPLLMDSSLWRDIEYYTFRIHSSGLLNFYTRSCFETALYAGLVTRLPANSEYTSAGLAHLAIAFIYLLVMCVLGGIVFSLEILHARVSERKKVF